MSNLDLRLTPTEAERLADELMAVLVRWRDERTAAPEGVALAGGLLVGAINPMLAAAEFERIPAALRAPVLGAVAGLAWAGIPFGGLLGGALVSWLGATGAILAVGGAYLLVTLDPVVRRRTWRLMDRTSVPVATGR